MIINAVSLLLSCDSGQDSQPSEPASLECPAVNVVCPEIPECPAAEVSVDVDIETLVTAIEDLASKSASNSISSDLDVWAHVGESYDDSSIWTNETSTTAVLTTAAAEQGCSSYDSSGNVEIAYICDSLRCSTTAWSPGTQGVLSIPIEPGGWIDCNSSNRHGIYLGGYYRQE